MLLLKVFATARNNETGEKMLFSASAWGESVPEAIEQAIKMIAQKYVGFSVILPKYIEYPHSMMRDRALTRPERKDACRYQVKCRNPVGEHLLSEFYVWATSAEEAENYAKSLACFRGTVVKAEKCDVFD